MTLTNKELVIATSTIWVVIAAILVMFMQAGFAFLEAGLTRMKNVGHVAAKNVLVLGIASIVYYLVGYGLAFGDGGNAIVGGSGFFPSVDELLAIGASPFSWFSTIPAGAGYLFQVVFAAVALAIVWGAMAERTKLWVYFAFGVVFTLIYSVVSHWIWHPDGWLFARGMQDFAGSTVVHYQGALAALAGALLLGPRIGKFGADGKPNAIPGHNMAFVTLGVIILWFGWFGFNPGSTLGVVTGDKLGYFAYVALTTNVAAAAGALGAVAVSWIVIKKPDLSMMLNGVIAALVAITAACGFVAPWAAIVIGAVAGSIAVLGVLGVERLRVDDPIGAVSVHGLAGVWGTLATGIFAVPALADNLATGTGGLVYTGSFHQLGVQALGLLAVGIFTFSASFGALWTMKKTFGIRVEPEVETAGLDVSEHGMWGYPEFYIPVPGGYGTESHGHLGLAHARSAPAHAHPHPHRAGARRLLIDDRRPSPTVLATAGLGRLVLGQSAGGLNPTGITLRLDSLRRTDRNVEERHPELDVRGAEVADAMNDVRRLDGDLSPGVCRGRAVVLVERQRARLDGHDRGARMEVPAALATRSEHELLDDDIARHRALPQLDLELIFEGSASDHGALFETRTRRRERRRHRDQATAPTTASGIIFRTFTSLSCFMAPPSVEV